MKPQDLNKEELKNINGGKIAYPEPMPGAQQAMVADGSNDVNGGPDTSFGATGEKQKVTLLDDMMNFI